MGVQYHPAVRQDVADAMRRYKAVSKKLADARPELVFTAQVGNDVSDPLGNNCMSISKSLRRMAPFTICCLALTCLPMLASDYADWQEHMRAMKPRSYVCRHATAAITVDGKLDEAAWS